ncbi:DNA replication complex GINS protein psf3 [Syncephalis plumigaleata]|nr:DNA replication complex GINS protein psf3 [Syncephalis plumigaleata]
MEDYYDIDGILSEQQRIPCEMVIEGTQLGFLDNNPGEDIPIGSQVELPLWLAGILAMSEQVGIEMPKAYGTSIRSSMKASTTNIDLHRLGPYYYLFGAKLTNIIDDVDLQKLLANTFRERLGIIMDYAHGRMGAEQTTMFARMDHTERDLYRIEQHSANLFRRWQRRELDHDDDGANTSRSTATLMTPLKRPASMI